jgi:hypothetical protein
VDEPDQPTGISLAPQATGELATVKNNAPSITMLHSLRPPFNYYTKDVSPSLVMSPTLRPPYRMETANRAPSMAMMTNLNKLAEYSEINVEDKPRVLWELQANRRMDEAPLMYGEHLIVAGADRSVFVCSKYAERQNRIRHEYLADRELSAPITQYGPELFVCVGDGNVYWVSVEDFRNSDIPVKQIKRYLSGMPIDRAPIVTDDSLYLAGSQAGVTRLDRKSFEKVWKNPDVDRVFAVNPNVVYAGDRRGNLVILDRARGLKLAAFDLRSFSFSVPNNRDDRLFLASDKGMLICLHDRAFRRTELLRKKEPKPPADPLEEPVAREPDPKKEPEAKKEAEPKKEPDAKKEVEPKKEPDAKKEADPKKDDDKKDDAKKD